MSLIAKSGKHWHTGQGWSANRSTFAVGIVRASKINIASSAASGYQDQYRDRLELAQCFSSCSRRFFSMKVDRSRSYFVLDLSTAERSHQAPHFFESLFA